MKMRKQNKVILYGILIFIALIASFPAFGFAAFDPGGDDGGRPDQKIAVFIWAEDVCTQSIINQYKATLMNEGYEKFFNFNDSSDYKSDLNDVDAYERSGDTLFFYLYGHGNYTGDYSYMLYNSENDKKRISSPSLRIELDKMEANRKGLLVEACKSGGFVEDFEDSPYFVMSSADKYHNALGIAPTAPCHGLFSYWFWGWVGVGYSDSDAFSIADTFVGLSSNQNPQMSDQSPYTFFD